MTAVPDSMPPSSRVPSTIAGLDRILGGGFLRGNLYLVAGPPGAGKTVLSNHVCFGHVAAGGRTVYITVLAETHTRLLAQLASFDFFTHAPLGKTMNYFSGYQHLETAGLPGLLEFLRSVVRDQRATLLVLDGLAPLHDAATSDLAYRHFLHDLAAYGEAFGCTTLLVTESDAASARPQYTMMDGVVLLHDRMVGGRAVRELQVLKLRGGAYLRGMHGFDITEAGVTVYPRLETLYPTPAIAAPTHARRSLGVPGLDAMLGGGLAAGTATMVLGTPGSGRTVLALHFLADGARHGETGLLLSFFEPPVRLREKAVRLGMAAEVVAADGPVAMLWQTALDGQLDELANRLLAAVEQRGVQRVVIDGLQGLQAAAVEPGRLEGFLTALLNELRGRGVTSVITAELRGWVGPAIEAPLSGLTPLVDNVLFLRHVELRSQLHRLLSVLKHRESDYDASIREFTITDTGITVAATFESAEAVLSGVARLLTEDAGAHGSSPADSKP